MKDRIKNSRYFKPLSYLLFFVFFFLLFFYLSLPVDFIKKKIIHEIESNTPFEVEIGSVGVKPIIGLKAKQVKLYKEGKHIIGIDELEVGASLFSILSSGKKLPFKANLLDGDVKGNIVYNTKTKQIERAKAKLKNIDIKKLPSTLTAYLGMEENALKGTLEGEFLIDLKPDTKGAFDFKIFNLGVKNMKLSGFPVPPLINLESSFKGQIENGITRIEELKFKGKDFDLNLFGTMPLLWKITKGAKIDLMVNLNILSKEAKLGIVRSFLTPQGDGSLGGKILGTIGNPRVVRQSRDMRRN